MRMMRFLVGSAVVATVLSTSATAVYAADPVAKVTVVHGLRGLVADIWLDGTKVLASFQPERSTDPLDIPAGKHQVEIREAGAAKTSSPLLSAQVTIPGGADLTVVAHLNATGQPALSVFRENAAKVPAGRARVIVRHAAAAPEIGIELDEKPLVSEVAPGAEASRDVAPGTHAVSVLGAGASAGTPLLAPQDVPLEEGTGMVLYLIGSQENRTLSWLAQPVRGRATPPTLIATGDSGLRAPADHPGSPMPAMPAAAALVGLVALTIRRRRAAR